MMPNEIEALAILASTPSLGTVKIKILLSRYGSACNALKANPIDLSQLPGFTPKILDNWGRWPNKRSCQEDLELAHKQGVQIIPFNEPSYPRRLLEITDHPPILYVLGELKPQDSQSIAIVGTRQASIYGLEMAELFSERLAAKGFTVISGLARGIDTAAHKGALKGGRTIAVIGSGLSHLYPQENAPLAKQISTRGALISEFPMRTPPDKPNFPQRNRIVAALTLGTLLIEAPEKSGAMLTMERARKFGRPCFAIPGRLDSENFQGNHSLIKAGYAKLVVNSEDIASSFESLFSTHPMSSSPVKPQISLEPEERNLLSLLPNEELSIEEIIGITKLSVMKLNVLLMSLVIKKVIKEYPGKLYKKIAWHQGCT